MANNFRLMSSGLRYGFEEINLPVMQIGSSIMPGKVNTVIPKVTSQVVFSISGTTANEARCQEPVNGSVRVITAICSKTDYKKLLTLPRRRSAPVLPFGKCCGVPACLPMRRSKSCWIRSSWYN